MPKRTDIKKILIIGSGPVTVGQGCEFDYACVQACRALREEGFVTVVVNSTPATLSTDPGVADRVYIEPLTVDSLSRIIEQERPDALLVNLGGQTALNLGLFLEREGVLAKFGCALIGLDADAIARAEDRKVFKDAMKSAGVRTPKSAIAGSIEEGIRAIKHANFPAIVKPAYATGGAGAATAYNMEEFVEMLAAALETSPIRQAAVEESVLDWKEIELEIVRDSADNTVIVTTIENIDPVGVHTGDSTAVAPAQTLTRSQLSELAEIARKAVRSVGVVGCANVEFGIDPKTGEIVVIELNPRFTRTSAFASKATGFAVARASALVAVGLTLDEIANEATGKPCLLQEPAMDYCAVRMCRFTFEKFPQAQTALGTSMKSVGDAIAIGRNFREALQKGIRSLEMGRHGLGSDGGDPGEAERTDADTIRERLVTPSADRLFAIRYAIEAGMTTAEISELSRIDGWFVEGIRELVEFETKLVGRSLVGVPSEALREAKRLGYSDIQLAHLLETEEEQVRVRRKVLGIKAGFCAVDSSAGEFEAIRPYFYSSYDSSGDAEPVSNPKRVIVLGGGPSRIGQGMEFDYCCASAALALREEGYEAVIINCNPGAVSTDPSISDRLYLEPLTLENVLAIVEREKPMGVIAQFGGHTSFDLGGALKKAGVSILDAPERKRDRASQRKLVGELARKLDLKQPENDTAILAIDVIDKADKLGYPLLVRATRVVGSTTWRIAYDEEDLRAFLDTRIEISSEHPLLMERFLEDAIKVGVDAISDGERALVCGVMEHIEQAGVHSGDSACSLPPYSLPDATVDEIKRQTRLLAKEIGVRGLINIHYAVKGADLYLLDVSPQASRTIGFVSKATGVSWAKVAAKVLVGKSLAAQGMTEEVTAKHVSVKEAVFPFVRFAGVDVVLGPEMKSTGDVMGIDTNFGSAFMKAEIAAGQNLPESGTAFVSVADADKLILTEVARKLKELGFDVVATRGTARLLGEAGVEAKVIAKIGEGRPDATDLIKNGEIDLIINTPSGKRPRQHEVTIRSTVVARGIPIITTMPGARATLVGMETVRGHGLTVHSLEDY